MFVFSLLFLSCENGSESKDSDSDQSLPQQIEDTSIPNDDIAEWAIYIFMNGDNDLESYVFYDLNELEEIGSSEDVHVVVQADRSTEYWEGDGNWTEARRYYITKDDEPNEVNSTLIESIGEVDMGSATVLEAFLLWAYDAYPAKHIGVIFWNHGESWSKSLPPPYISWDEGSGNALSFAEGDVNTGLSPLVDRHGPIDLVGFDACYMSSWEVAHSLRENALYMTAAETVVGMDGYHYPYILESLMAAPQQSPEQVAYLFAESAGSFNGEWTHAMLNLSAMGTLDSAINEVSDVFLNDPSLSETFKQLRAQSASADAQYHDYFLDLGSFGEQLQQSEKPALRDAGDSITEALGNVIGINYNNSPFDGIWGLSIFADSSGRWSEGYGDGAGASWAQETRWDDWILSLETK